MATHTGTTDNRVRADTFYPYPGQVNGLGIPFAQQVKVFLSPITNNVSGTVVDVPKAATKTIETIQGTTDLRAAGPSYDWFDSVHLLPRTPIDFGNIITLVEEEYIAHSAYRTASVTLVSVTNNGLPGINLPNLTPPVVLSPQESLLDPSSTSNDGGVGLGTLVQMKIQALSDGLPTFDTTVDFLFSDGDELSLGIMGTRIVFLPVEYEAPVNETLAFLTDIITSLDGKEQRIALRENPRQLFDVEYVLDENDRQRMQAVLMDWMDNLFGFPLFHEQVELTAAHTAGGTTYAITQGDQVDFRVGGLAAVMSSADVFDVIRISAVTPTQITASDPSTNSYAIGAKVLPLRLARIVEVIPTEREVNNIETFRVRFEVSDNDTGVFAGSISGWSTYLGKVLLDDGNVVRGTMPGQLAHRIYRVDNSTGQVGQVSIWPKNKRSQEKGFVARSRAEILKLKKLLLAHNGRQKSFYIPTFIEDLDIVANLTLGSATMDIANIEYTRFIGSREPKATFRITFTDGTSLVRIVQSSTKISATVERLTLDTTWPANRTVAEISRVQFYELARFDSDEFVISYPRVGLARLVAPVKQAFDL